MSSTRALTLALIGSLLLWAGCAQTGGALERLGWKGTSSGVASLSQEEIARALREALSAGVEQAVARLGRTDGFLRDAEVRIPMPEGLDRVERTLRTLRQDRLADDFIATMNRAAERAVPEAAGVLGQAIFQMTIADARSILTGPEDAATQYFRRTSEEELYQRFLPIVQKATEQAGVTSAYKKMTAQATTGLAGVGAGLLGWEAPDLDAYVTRKSLDGLFLKIASQEQLIRENPAARTTELLQRVFGAVVRSGTD